MPLPLETERLLIRPFTSDDVEAVHLHVLSDADVMRWASPDRLPFSLEQSREAVERYVSQQQMAGFSMWAVVDRSSGALVGICGLIPYAWRGPEVEIGYRIRRSSWRRGYATEAARASLAFGFAELGLERIVAVTDPMNVASKRVLEGIGMTYEGVTDYGGHESLLYVTDRP